MPTECPEAEQRAICSATQRNAATVPAEGKMPDAKPHGLRDSGKGKPVEVESGLGLPGGGENRGVCQWIQSFLGAK